MGAPALYVFSIPGSASDHRSPLNVKRDLKKMLRELGVAVGPERTEPPSQPLKTPSRVDIALQEIADLNKRVQAIERGQ